MGGKSWKRSSLTNYTSNLFTVLSSSLAELNSPREMILINVFVACPTARDVFFAAPATTGCREMTGRLALSWIIALDKENSNYFWFLIWLKQKPGNLSLNLKSEEFNRTHSLVTSKRTYLSNSSFCHLHSLSRFAYSISYLLAEFHMNQSTLIAKESFNNTTTDTWRLVNAFHEREAEREKDKTKVQQKGVLGKT